MNFPGLHAVFRLKSDANALFEQFRRSGRQDGLLTVSPSDTARQQQPDTAFHPCRVRLVRYTAGDTAYLLATTLLDSRRYSVAALSDLYHARWGIEELYQISKQCLQVEHFHGQSERLVRQELNAHFSLIAMTRLFTNQSEAGFRSAAGKQPLQANFRNGLRTVGRHLEGLFLTYASTLSETVSTILASIASCRQRQRPNRSYPARFAPARQQMEASQARTRPDLSLTSQISGASVRDTPISLNRTPKSTKRMPLPK